MKRWIILLIVVLILVAAGGYRIHVKRNTPLAQSIDTIQLEQGLPVRVFQAKRRDLNQTVAISGTIEPLCRVAIAPKVTDRIESIDVTTGQEVKQNQRLVTLDTKTPRLMLAQAAAAVNQAQRQLEKLQSGSRKETIDIAQARRNEAAAMAKLREIEFKRQTGLYSEEATTLRNLQNSEQEHGMAKAAHAAAQADYEMAVKGPRDEDIRIAEADLELAKVVLAQRQQDLDDHYLNAPCSGVITTRLLEPGDIVEINDPIFSVLAIDQVKLVIDASELHLSHIRLNMDVEVTVDALSDHLFAGRIVEINPQANQTDRSFRTKIIIDNKDRLLFPGMFARAHIITERIENALVVPNSAIRTDGTQRYVLTVTQNNGVTNTAANTSTSSNTVANSSRQIARRVDVSVGAIFGEMIQVTEGLSQGDPVITFAQGILEPGIAVTVAQQNGDTASQ